ncbi:MAG: hypothetical protein V4591_08895, partial [Bdellovibrionota bacterium]
TTFISCGSKKDLAKMRNSADSPQDNPIKPNPKPTPSPNPPAPSGKPVLKFEYINPAKKTNAYLFDAKQMKTIKNKVVPKVDTDSNGGLPDQYIEDMSDAKSAKLKDYNLMLDSLTGEIYSTTSFDSTKEIASKTFTIQASNQYNISSVKSQVTITYTTQKILTITVSDTALDPNKNSTTIVFKNNNTNSSIKITSLNATTNAEDKFTKPDLCLNQILAPLQSCTMNLTFTGSTTPVFAHISSYTYTFSNIYSIDTNFPNSKISYPSIKITGTPRRRCPTPSEMLGLVPQDLNDWVVSKDSSLKEDTPFQGSLYMSDRKYINDSCKNIAGNKVLQCSYYNENDYKHPSIACPNSNANTYLNDDSFSNTNKNWSNVDGSFFCTTTSSVFSCFFL